ncbi:hypothetical protein ABZX99_16685 [Streptomyces antibioticus]|uniref:hypothetical protein n=1 Tax=Streptomyces TaxID=1883 RepID=UPI002814A9DD|nr:hypothetical protein [Streptomyces sp. CAI-85]
MDDTRPWYVASAPERYGRLRVEREDLGAARWLAELGPRQEDFGTVAGIAVPGFAAYVRVPHPASPDERPVSSAHPAEGPTPVGVARHLLPVLARHTRTAERCWFGLWAGYGRRSFDGVPCFETPHRERVLLSGPLDDVLSPVEPDAFAELPDLWWPQDRAWCVGGDVDLVSTYIGGSPELIAELLASPLLETVPVSPGDSVH